jgi:hypothetical protein
MSDFGEEELARDAIAIINGGTASVTWDDVDYDGVIGALVTTKPNVSGGFLPEYDLSWTTSLQKLNDAGELVERFTDDELPEEGEVLTIADVDYRVERVTMDPYSAMVQFDLVNTAKQ